MNPNEQFNQWLQENGYAVQVLVTAPKGGYVSVDNYLPDGWKLDMQIIRTKAQAGVAINGQTDTSYPSDRVLSMGVAVQ